MTVWHKLRWIVSKHLLVTAYAVSPQDDLQHFEHIAAAACRATDLVKGIAKPGDAA